MAYTQAQARILEAMLNDVSNECDALRAAIDALRRAYTLTREMLERVRTLPGDDMRSELDIIIAQMRQNEGVL
jgi:prefoldin subunit 5